MRRRRVTLEIKYAWLSGSAVPAGDRHPFRLAFHSVERLARHGCVKLDAAPVVYAPDDRGKSVEGPDDDEHVVARRRHVARVESSALGRKVRDDDRARTAEAKCRAG